jgi:putative peptide zinc metalloprotease protein
MPPSTSRPDPVVEEQPTRGGQPAAPRPVSEADGQSADRHGDGDGRATDTGAPAIRLVEPPRLADGVEMLGRYEGSAFKEPPLMARRADGQILQLPPILYVVAEQIDGRRTDADVAEAASRALERTLDPEDVRYLISEKLAPLGIVATEGTTAPAKADPLLALRLRTRVVPPGLVRAATAIFRPLFLPPVLVAAVVAFIAFDAWLFSAHGIAQSVRALLYQPAVLLLLLGLVVFAAAFHEFGHATGSRYGGAPPGAMGFGIYLVWPAFYTDISESHRLGRGGRLRADLGGIYFHALFVLGLGSVYAVTRYEPLLLVAVLLQVEMVRQMLPLLRFDGYYVVSDLVGIPDLFLRLKPILVSALPWRKPDPKVTELKTWARVIVTIWVFVVILAIGFYLVAMAVAAPRIVATAWDSFFTHLHGVGAAWHDHQTLRAVLSAIQLVALSLPALGIAYTAVRLGGRLVKAWRALAGRPVARTALVAGVAAIVCVLAYLWLPRQAYRPIGPHERWTAGQLVSAATHGSTIDPSAWRPQRPPSSGVPANRGGVGPTSGPSLATTTPTPSPSASPSATVSTSSPTASASATTSPTSTPTASSS